VLVGGARRRVNEEHVEPTPANAVQELLDHAVLAWALNTTGSCSLSSRKPIDMTSRWRPSCETRTGDIFCSLDWPTRWPRRPSRCGMDGPHMSRSSRPTRRPRDDRAHAICAATVLLPTPPLPERTTTLRARRVASRLWESARATQRRPSLWESARATQRRPSHHRPRPHMDDAIHQAHPRWQVVVGGSGRPNNVKHPWSLTTGSRRKLYVCRGTSAQEGPPRAVCGARRGVWVLGWVRAWDAWHVCDVSDARAPCGSLRVRA
jgi:hypothetical protein